MKKWILPLLAVVLTVSACGVLSSETREEKSAREAREAQMVVDNLQNANFRIDIDRMYPVRGTSQHVSNYSVTVKDGVLDSHLPFIGQAWRVPYGGGHALNFKADIGSYRVVQTRKDGYEVRIYVKTDEDEHLYLLTVFNNGRASLDVQSGNRDRISYSGEMNFYTEEK
jgi:hypothetical protein